jgi:hypothetical protein
MKNITFNPRNRNYLFLLITMLCINISLVPAQESIANDTTEQWPSNHEFAGKIFIDGEKANDVVVKVFDRNTCFSNYTTKGNGKFFFTAESEKYYTLQFEKEGYVTKRVVVKTHKTEGLDYFTKEYKFDIDLEKELDHVDYSLHDFPAAIIQIDNNQKEFEANKKYSRNLRETMKLKSQKKSESNSQNAMANK